MLVSGRFGFDGPCRPAAQSLLASKVVLCLVFKFSVALRPQTIGTMSILCLVLKLNVALRPQKP